MSFQKIIANYSEYNEWATNKTLHWLDKVDQDFLFLPCPSSYNSISKTLVHLLDTQNFWMQFIAGKNVSRFTWNEDRIQDDLFIELRLNCAQLKTQMCSYSDEDLIEFIALDMPWAKNKLARYEYIIHLINHTTYHRGQIITIAHQLGIAGKYPNTDYNFYTMER